MRALALAIALGACSPTIPEGRAACTIDTDCPAGWSCRAEDRGGRCWSTPGGAIDGGSPDGSVPEDARPLDAGAPCESAGDCDDGSFCNGEETCDPSDPSADPRGCVAGADPCDDGIVCTTDACSEAERCRNEAPDEDGDGFADAACIDRAGAPLGDDCDDDAPGRHPGAIERCNGDEDDDCDGVGDATDPDVECAWGCEADLMGCDVPEHVVTGDAHTCAQTVTGRTYCWGDNAHGQLGDGTATSRSRPLLVEGLMPPVSRLAAGARHTCVIDARGVVCWGDNAGGQLGSGSAGGSSATPAPVAGTLGWGEVEAGAVHTCAGDSVALRCWGGNDDGQLGDGTRTAHFTPRPVDGTATTTASRRPQLGGRHACFRSGSGNMWCWGDNASGQTGTGSTGDDLIPTDVAGDGELTALATGDSHTCVWHAGSVDRYECFGENGTGQLGDGTTTDRRSLAAVTSATGLAAVGAPDHLIGAGTAHTCATDAAMQLWCWGDNASGQLGTGDLTSSLTPRRSAFTGTIGVVAAGAAHTCVISMDRVLCWGANDDGQLGDGTTTDSAMPVEATP